jgi:hypothetical protein
MRKNKLGWTFVHNFVFIHDYLQCGNKIYTLLVNIWFTSSNANKIRFTSYYWGPKDVEPTRVVIAIIIELEKL